MQGDVFDVCYTQRPDRKGTERSYSYVKNTISPSTSYTQRPDRKGTERIESNRRKTCTLLSVTLKDPIERGLKGRT